MFKRVLSLILALVLFCVPLLGGAGTVSAASATEDMEALIEKRIRAFADSIDQNKADANAATALAKHGISGRGKKLQVGQNHALTATLMNAEGTIDSLSYGLMRALTVMQHSNMQEIYAECDPNWNSANDIASYVDLYSDAKMEESSRILMSGLRTFSGKPNEYDKSLVWITGCTGTTVTIRRETVSKDSITYDVKIKFWDRFDFSTSNGSGFKDLISGIGAILFKEFDWEATAGLKLTVPNDCTHGGKNYHWTYDASQMLFTPDDSEEYTANGMLKVVEQNGDTYHKLDVGARLRHDIPWVVEYKIKNPNKFAYSLSESKDSKHDYLLHYDVRFLFAARLAYDAEGNPFGQYYGTALNKYFKFNKTDLYTFRLENMVQEDGSNMVYVTVHNDTLGQTVMEKTPMDDYYVIENGSWILTDKQSNGICGMDFDVWYIGNSSYRFTPDEFELWIWEDGLNPDEEMHFTKSVTKPTCTKQGYTTYTCSLCGYGYQGDKVKAKGHNFGEWSVTTAATCTEAGEEQRTCKTCKEVEVRAAAAKGHSYEALVTAPTCTEPGYTTFACACGHSYVGDDTAPLGHSFEGNVCTVCGEAQYIPGDTDLDDDVDVDDVLVLLWNVLFPDDYPIDVDADFNGSGTTDVDDVLTLLWHVLFPEDYPLN